MIDLLILNGSIVDGTGNPGYYGNVIVEGRRSDHDSLFDPSLATFEDDAGAYDQADADGFIKLNALRLRVRTKRST